MNVLVCDDTVSEQIIAERRSGGLDRYDEVWEGVYVVSPIANNEHQGLAARISWAFREILPSFEDVEVFAGINVSDREDDWTKNYRVPDVAVILAGNPAKDCGTHWCGGPDLVVEIVSPKDRSREKLEFYSAIGVRKFWILDRKPWKIEIYDNVEGQLILQGAIRPESSKNLKSGVLGAAVSMQKGKRRPAIQIKTAKKALRV